MYYLKSMANLWSMGFYYKLNKQNKKLPILLLKMAWKLHPASHHSREVMHTHPNVYQCVSFFNCLLSTTEGMIFSIQFERRDMSPTSRKRKRAWGYFYTLTHLISHVRLPAIQCQRQCTTRAKKCIHNHLHFHINKNVSL